MWPNNNNTRTVLFGVGVIVHNYNNRSHNIRSKWTQKVLKKIKIMELNGRTKLHTLIRAIC